MKLNEFRDMITGYQILTSVAHGYQLIDIKLVVDYFSSPDCRFHWQANNDYKYYGGTLKLISNNVELMYAIVKFISTFKCMNPEWIDSFVDLDSLSPLSIVNALEERHVNECQYHNSSNKFYTQDNWPTKGSWKMMDYNSKYPYIKHLFADSESEAVIEAAKYIVNTDRHSDWFEHRTVEFLNTPQAWIERPQLAPID